ncbi:MAG: helix-hairpin-helix domain-containing protein [Pseudomonadota bacterium]
MKKLLVALFACFALIGAAFAADPVDLNTATQAQLETVKGIGPAKAKAIIEYRTKSGPFKSVDDLEKVSGFGKKTVDSVRSQVTVGGAAKPADAKKADEKGAAKGEAKDAKKPAK